MPAGMHLGLHYKVFGPGTAFILPAMSHKYSHVTLMLTILLLISLQTIHSEEYICPVSKCFCFHNRMIDCYQMQLQTIPPFIYKNNTYDEIDLSKNRFKRLHSDCFQNLKVRNITINRNKKPMIMEEGAFKGLEDTLQVLQMAGNTIHTVPPRIFRRLKTLKLVYMPANRMQYLPEMAFHGAENMESLSLEANKLKIIKSLTFRGLKNLKKLRIGKNNIAMVESRAFVGLRSLEVLDMDNNNIRDLQPNTFRRLSNLKTLDLSSNSMSALFPLMFKGLRALETLDLTNNPIMMIADSTFSPMEKLIRLTINKAKLNSLKPGMFKGLKSLRVLELYHNNLHDLPDEVFFPLKSLQKIMLDDNELKTINPCAFKSVQNMKEIYVFDNKIYCDCAIGWTSLQNSPDVYGLCSGPETEKDRDISEASRYAVCTFSGMECGKIMDSSPNESAKLWIRFRRAYRKEPALFFGKR